MNTLPPMVPLLLYLMLQTDPQLSPNACGSTRSLSTKQYRRVGHRNFVYWEFIHLQRRYLQPWLDK